MGARIPEAVGSRAEAGIARIRELQPEDMEAVARMEAELFSTPWSARTFRGALGGPGAVLLGLEEDSGALIGYAVFWCLGDHGELANIAITRERQGRGLGSLLLDEVLRIAEDRGVRQLFLEVRESNDRAQTLYARRGFITVGRRRAYYQRPREDAVVLMKRFPGQGVDRARLRPDSSGRLKRE